ncbi:MAG: sugar transferase [Bacteroidota bacterium]
MAKRLFDISMSLLALGVFALPMILIALLIKFKEHHPILFKQERLGIHKQPFLIFKFQTLVNEEATPIGKVLRKTGLDELPQFINVLKGEMSIVGPRALTASDIKRLGWDNEFHSQRWKVLPGITGLAQLYGGRHRKLSWFWDTYYLHNQTLPIDLGIIFFSFLVNFFGKRSVRKLLPPLTSTHNT